MIAYFTRHPNAANLLMLAIMALGIFTVPNLKRETFPELLNDEVQIQAVYPGATSGEVEDAVCRRIENAVEGVHDLTEIQCEGREGNAIAVATMREDASMMRFLADVKDAIDAIDDFPDEVEKPVISELGRTEFIASVAVTGPETATDLKNYAEDLKSRLQELDSVATVELKGFADRQIRIEIPRHVLERHGLSALDIANAVRARSLSVPAGLIEGNDEDIILRVDDQRTSPARFADIVVLSGTTGGEIRLGAIATITDMFEKAENKVIFNGRRAAMLDVYKTKANDVLDVVDEVKAFVAEESKRVPSSMSLTVTRDVGSIVRDRLSILLSNGIQGLVLVFLILSLFFSLRFSFWVAMGLPVSFLGTLFAMTWLGMSLNMITMVGLLIAIGLLMDDAIVISENIASRLAKGDRPIPAAIAGAREVAPGILSSFTTTVLIFGALIFLDGRMGQILGVLPVILITTLLVSLVEAFLILPHHLSHSLHAMHGSKPSRFRAGFERAFTGLRERVYGPILDRAVAWRYFTVGLVVLLLMASIAMLAGGVLKVRGFPDVDGDLIEARILLPQGTPLSRTEAVVEGLLAELDAVDKELTPLQPEGQALVQNIAIIYSSNADAYETGPHVATISVDVLGSEIRTVTIDDIRNRWRDRVGMPPDVIAIKYTEATVGIAGRAIDLRLSGQNLDRLKAASLEMQAWLRRFAGVNDLSDDLRPGKREIRLRVKDGADALNLTSRAVADQVRAAYQGIIIDEFPIGAETYEVDLRVAADDRQTLDGLRTMMLSAPDGTLVPLQNVADFTAARGWARINRIDGRRTVSVQGDIDTQVTNTAEIITALKTQFVPELLKRHPGVRFAIEGESANSAETRQSMARNMLLGLIGVYILLAFQFRGYIAPFLIMAVIPTALIGVIWGHLIVGLELSMPSLIGGAALAGVVVNNAILMMQFIGTARKAGASADEAARQTGRSRFRPIILTSATTVFGLLPLLLERSFQAQILIPLATSLAFGLGVATILSLFLMPALYCILNDFGLVRLPEDEEDDDEEREPAAAAE
ncbi:MAG: AcrB/AcrD/AcrF family protein [Hyphomicrobiales bacterium]|nr:MAG: AcrB/AcrD/AcrF family protein [Hyphomicrobiales bacterium]